MAKKKQFQHIDMQHNEVQNVKGHNLNTTPEDVVESQYWYDTVNHRFKFHNGTSVKDFGKEYTAGTGIDITGETVSIDNTVVATQTDLESKQDALTFSTGLTDTNDTITVTDYDKLLKNKAISDSDTNLIIVGNMSADSTNPAGNIVIGKNAGVSGTLCYFNTAVGYNADCFGRNCVSIGYDSYAKTNVNSTYSGAIGIGFGASASADNAIQIGRGQNTTASTLYVGFKDTQYLSDSTRNYELLDGTTGLIPDARLSSNIARTSAIPTKLSDLTDDLGSSPTHTHSQYLTQHQDISGKADKATSLAGYGITDAYTKTEVDGKLTGAMHYKGTVATVAALDNISSPAVGDVYNVTATGDNYAYDGTNWDKLSGVVDLSTYDNHIADTTIHVTSSDKSTWNGKQNAITSSAKLSSDLVDDTNKTNKFVTSTEKSTWNGKQDAITSTAKLSADLVQDGTTNKVVTQTEKNTWNGKQDALGYTPCKKITADNTALTASGGQVTWTITNSIGSKYVGIHVYETSTGEEIECSKAATASTITIKMNSTSNIAANTYYAVIIG